MSFVPWWIKYPNVNDEIMNLDWLLRQMEENGIKIDNFINLNTIKYADPILWDITSQYEANTIVVDPQTGDAYISTKAVPYGVSLSNTDYWTKIYNYADEINNLQEQIAAANEKLSTTATASRDAGDLVWLNGKLYIVTSPMIAGDSYVEGSNCEKVTIEDVIGNLALLDTVSKSNLVAAINEVLSTLSTSIGDLALLDTTDKSSLVAAINEVLSTLGSEIGDLATLSTTDKSSLVGAINELYTDISNIDTTENFADVKKYGAVGDGVTDDSQAFTDAIASGLEVYIPAGVYYLPNGITLTGTNKSLRGAGRGLTKIKTDGSHVAIKCTALTYFNISKLSIDTATNGIEMLNNTAWGSVEDIDIVNCTQGVYCHGEYFPTPTSDVIEIHFKSVSFHATSGSVKGFAFYCIGDIWLEKCMAQTNTTNGTALYVNTGVSALYCDGCNFIGNAYAVVLDDANHPDSNLGGRPEKPHDIFFNNCLFDSSNYTAVWKKCYNINATGCWFGGSTHAGLLIQDGAININLDSCEIHANSENGIWVAFSTFAQVALIISNCRIYDNTSAAIQVTNARVVLIEGNLVRSNGSGIVVDASCFDITVVGNQLISQTISLGAGSGQRNYAMVNTPIDQNTSNGCSTT